MRQIQAIASTIFVSISVVSFFMVESKLLLGREFNCGHCLSQFFSHYGPAVRNAITLIVNFNCSSTFCNLEQRIECTNHKPPCDINGTA